MRRRNAGVTRVVSQAATTVSSRSKRARRFQITPSPAPRAASTSLFVFTENARPAATIERDDSGVEDSSTERGCTPAPRSDAMTVS
jgi:hypothetical protein